MGEYYSTITTPYNQIQTLLTLLKNAKVHPKIDSPNPTPSNPTEIVEVPLTIKAQGDDHVRIARGILTSNPQRQTTIITEFTPLPTSRGKKLLDFLAERSGDSLAILVGTVGSVYVAFGVLNDYMHNTIQLQWYHHIEFVGMGFIPVLVDLGYSYAYRRKNAFKIKKSKSIQNTNNSTGNVVMSVNSNVNTISSTSQRRTPI